jgi:hypothetical protein
MVIKFSFPKAKLFATNSNNLDFRKLLFLYQIENFRIPKEGYFYGKEEKD